MLGPLLENAPSIAAAAALCAFAGGVWLRSQWRAMRERQASTSRELHDACLALQEASREQLRLREELLSHVSHELRTPLASAMQFVAMVSDGVAGPLNDEQTECLKGAVRNIDELRRLVTDLVDASRLRSREVALNAVAVDVRPLLRETVEAARERAALKGLSVEAVEDGPPLLARADPLHLRQVIVHLLDNAVKFTPAGGHISAAASRASGDVQISICNSGPGIERAAQEKLFLPLYQVAREDAPSRKGLGLGLFLSSKLVELQGGRIWVDSDPARGAAFHFTLPSAGNP